MTMGYLMLSHKYIFDNFFIAGGEHVISSHYIIKSWLRIQHPLIGVYLHIFEHE